MELCIKSILAAAILFVCASAEINYDIIYTDDAPRMSENTITEMVSYTLGLNEEHAPYFQATVKVYRGDYFVVTLFRSDCYEATVYRLDYKGNEIVRVTPDYVEESREEELCGTCPNPEIEAVISYIEDALFPGAIQHGWGTYNMLIAEGIKSELVIGHRETKQTMLNWLACKNLKVWGRIGHGTTNGITFNDYQGKLTASELAGMADDIKGKTFIFNSCKCHNDPFEPAMMAAGAYFFAGGDISLSGGKEEVFSSFFNYAVKQQMELSKAMQQATKTYPNAWGWTGDGSSPYYLKFGVTDMSNNPSSTTNGFTVLITSDRVFFNTPGESPIWTLSIFNPLGKLIYQSPEARVWHLITSHGQKVNEGTYIAVIKDQGGTESAEKAFTIVK